MLGVPAVDFEDAEMDERADERPMREAATSG